MPLTFRQRARPVGINLAIGINPAPENALATSLPKNRLIPMGFFRGVTPIVDLQSYFQTEAVSELPPAEYLTLSDRTTETALRSLLGMERESRDKLVAAYHERAGELPESFILRHTAGMPKGSAEVYLTGKLRDDYESLR